MLDKDGFQDSSHYFPHSSDSSVQSHHCTVGNEVGANCQNKTRGQKTFEELTNSTNQCCTFRVTTSICNITFTMSSEAQFALAFACFQAMS